MTVGKDAECILLMMAQEIGGIRAKEFSSHWKKIKPKTSVPLIQSISEICVLAALCCLLFNAV